MLSDFFRINLPYGIAKNRNNEWMAFNREYLPLGFNNENYREAPGENYTNLPVYTKYKQVPEHLLLELADEKHAVQRDKNGEIIRLYLYNDGTNPVNQFERRDDLWKNYFHKLERLSELKRTDEWKTGFYMMREIKIEDKQKYLDKNYIFDDIPELADRKRCLHCGSIIIVGNYKVFADEQGGEYIYCPNAPECDGTIIDWMDV
nr:hypothetical protein [uncultured Draconibacterium sp.]